jgi:hypothetical protein
LYAGWGAGATFMISLFMSGLILLLPVAVAIIFGIYLWWLGLIARCCLLLICVTGAIEVNSIVSPSMGIKEKYEQLQTK